MTEETIASATEGFDLGALLEGFDLASMLPDLEKILGGLAQAVRFCVLAGPVVLIILGIWYLLLPPKEANHHVGYRTFWGMSSVEAWRFTQVVAGIVWTVLGIVLGIIMRKRCAAFDTMAPTEFVQLGVKYLIEELIAVVLSRVVIALPVLVVFNFRGYKRKWFRTARDLQPEPRRGKAKEAQALEAPKEAAEKPASKRRRQRPALPSEQPAAEEALPDVEKMLMEEPMTVAAAPAVEEQPPVEEAPAAEQPAEAPRSPLDIPVD